MFNIIGYTKAPNKITTVKTKIEFYYNQTGELSEDEMKWVYPVYQKANEVSKGHNSLGNQEICVKISELVFHTSSNILHVHFYLVTKQVDNQY